MIGLPEMPLSDITLTNVTLTARDGLQIVHAQDIRFVNSRVAVTHGAPVTLEDAKVTGLASGETTASVKNGAKTGAASVASSQ